MKRRTGVKVIAQRKNWDCGIASLAMLLGVPYGDVAAAAKRMWSRLPPNRRGILLSDMEAFALEQFDVRLARRYWKHGYLEGQTGIIGLVGGKMNWAGHWAVLKAGAVIDPDDGTVWAVDDYTKANKCRTGVLLVRAE